MQGNVDFDESEHHETVKVKNHKVIEYVADLLQVDVGEVEKAMSTRVVAANREVVEKGHNLEQARHAKDAFAKVSIDFVHETAAKGHH